MSASTDKKYLSCAETAKLLRKALKAEFSGQEFSVRSKTYSGGASIHVYYTDGPPSHNVQAVCDLFCGASFDGMIDLKSYHDSILTTEDGAEVVHFGADFIFAERTTSQEWRNSIARQIERLSGEPCDLSPQGAGWRSYYPLCVVNGQLSLYADQTDGIDLHAQYTAKRWRIKSS